MPKKPFRVYEPDAMDADDAKVVEHYDHEDAAAKYAADDDAMAAEWQQERTLMVQEVGEESWKVVKVFAEPTIEYRARMV